MSTENGYFSNPSEVEADLSLHEGVLWARSALTSRLTSSSKSKSASVLDMLRTDSMAQLCEFYYLLKARNITSETGIERFAELHNAHIVNLSKDSDKMKRLGLKSDRILEAIFTSDTLPRLVATWKNAPGSLDQSNLARFLTTIMSTETCRKLVVASHEAGFLLRERSPFGTTLVSSTGLMEQIFASTLRDLRKKIKQIEG